MRKRTFLSLLLLVACVVARAYSFEYDGVYYNIISSSERTVEVTYKSFSNETFSQDGYVYYRYNTDYNPHDVSIPSTVRYNDKDYVVKRIGKHAFAMCQLLWTVSIPNTVTEIDFEAFVFCSGLESINIPESVSIIGDRVFENCTSLSSINISEGVTQIGYNAFYKCRKLSSIVIPESVTSIGAGAFEDCSNLTSISLSSHITSLPNVLLMGCSKLSSIIIPYGVTTIGKNVFSGCSSLGTISVPSSITSITSESFYGLDSVDTLYWDIPSVSPYEVLQYCKSSIKSVTLGANAKKIDSWIFAISPNLKSLKVDPDNPLLDSRNDCNAIIHTSTNILLAGCAGSIIPNGVTSIYKYAFFNCTNLTSVALPESLTSIGDSAFIACANLKTVSVSKNLEEIGFRAFFGCAVDSLYWNNSKLPISSVTQFCKKSLQYAVLGDEVKKIGDGDFIQCVNLKEVIFPDSISTIGNYAFRECTSLKELFIPKSVISIGYYTFYGCENLTKLGVPEKVLSIGEETFNGCINVDSLYWETSFVSPHVITQFCGSKLKHVVLGRYLNNIGDYAFSECVELTSLVIPEQVESIGKNAFYNCKKLSELTIPEHVKTIGDHAFFNCWRLSSINIPSGITTIEESTFHDCSGLTSIIIPDGVTSIGQYAFENCTGLKSIIVPQSVNIIKNDAFYNCSGLTSIVIPDAVTDIGSRAFFGCANISTITIPRNLTKIGDSAFERCSKLTSVKSEQLFDVVGEVRNVFAVCSSLDTLYWNSNASARYVTSGCNSHLKNVFLGDSMTTIGQFSFLGCIGLTTVVIPDKITRIGQSAFSGCTNLRRIILPNGVTDIESGAFSNCNGLEMVSLSETVSNIGITAFDGCAGIHSLRIPKSVSSIGVYAFRGCSNIDTLYWDSDVSPANVTYYCKDKLRYVVLGDSVSVIENSTSGYNAFSDCVHLTSIAIPSTVKSIKYNSFLRCSNLDTLYWNSNCSPLNVTADLRDHLKYVFIGDSVTEIGGRGFEHCEGLSSITIPENVRIIGSSAFRSCTGFTSISLPNSVITIGSDAFSDCTGLTSLVFPNSLTTIGPNAFSGCTGVTSIVVPQSVMNIGNGAFKGCTKVDSIVWNSSVSPYCVTQYCRSALKSVSISEATTIGSNAFYECTELTSMIISPTVSSIGDNAFYGCTGLSSILIPQSVSSIGEKAFYGCSGLTSIVLPNELSSIGRYLFYQCSTLTSINIPEGVAVIGESAFNGCSNLSSVSIPEGIKELSYRSFAFCKNLKNISIPNSVSEISNQCFEGCTSIESIIWNSDVSPYYLTQYCKDSLKTCVLGDSIETIGASAFKDCKKLTSIILPERLTSIENSAFSGCSGLTSLRIPDDVTTIGSYSFNNCSGLKTLYVPKGLSDVGNYAFYGCNNVDTIYWNSKVSLSAVSNYCMNNLRYVELGDNVTIIGGFSGCKLLTNLVIPSNATKIADYAFNGCTGLSSLLIPESVRSIGTNAFNGCTRLERMVLPSGISSIGEKAFYGCSGLKSIILPDSLTRIESQLFYDCSSLAHITVPEKVNTIGSSAFRNCTKLNSLNVSRGLSSYNYNAFEDCANIDTIYWDNNVSLWHIIRNCNKNLKYVSYGENVTSISGLEGCTSLRYVSISSGVSSVTGFSNCTSVDTLIWYTPKVPINDIASKFRSSLRYVVLGNAIDSIPAHAFEECYNLNTVVVPDGITNIGQMAFYRCSNLSTINIPNSVVNISDRSFWGCSKLISINIPDGITRLNEYVFYNCSGLKSINIPNSVTAIDDYAFYGCSGLDSIVIPEGVYRIGTYAFSGCSNITSITIPSKVISLGACVFLNCTGLTTVNFLGKSNYLHNSLFENCNALKSIDIPFGVKSIMRGAFRDCTGLEAISIPCSVNNIEDGAFDGCSNIKQLSWNSNVSPECVTKYCSNKLEKVYLGDSVTIIGEVAFRNCVKLTSILFPESISFIGWQAFKGCTGLTSLTIPNSVTGIQIEAFRDCHIDTLIWNSFVSPHVVTADLSGYLKHVVLGDSITSISNEAFSGCINLSSILIPNTVSDIGSSAFQACHHLTKIEIPENVTSIGSNAFYACEGLNTIISESPYPPVLSNDVFGVLALSDIELKVPYESYRDYSNADIWRSFGKISTIEGLYDLSYYVDEDLYYTNTIHQDSLTEKIAEPIKEGYSFSGWSEIPDTMPDRNVNVTGSFGINTYKLLYLIDSIEYKSFDVVYKGIPDSVKTPIKEGHTFLGWSAVPDSMPAKDVTIVGSFAINNYKLIYLIDDTVEYGKYDVTFKEKLSAIEGPQEREGYTFSGWSEMPDSMPSHDLVICGTFGINRYKLTYLIDSVEYKSFDVVYKGIPDSVKAPVKEGYSFSGWSAIPDSMPAKDVVINGSFNINSYKLNYVVDDTVEYKSFGIKYKEKLSAIAAPMDREGYTFSGWSVLPDSMPARDVVVKGSYNINSYKLRYIVDDTVVYKVFDIKYKEKLSMIADTIAEGYTFSGWSALPGTMPATNVDVKGSFSINSYILTYKVDGEVYHKDTLNYATAVTPLTSPTKEGYTFSGWNKLPEIMPAKDVEVTSSFSINSYIITYKVDGEVYHKDTLNYATAVTALAEPNKEGYTFSGWSNIPTTMPAKDVVINGSFNINSYKLNYVIDDTVEYKSFDIKYKEKLSAIAAPMDREGYTFSGWSVLPDSMPARDVVVKGSYNINSYKLRYIVDDTVVYKVFDIKYKEKLSMIADTIAEGYTFSGWSALPGTMPANNVDVKGSFIINSYILTYKVDGEVYHKDTLNYATAVTPLTSPAKEGYTFSGWNKLPEIMPAKDVEVTSSFSINSYIITYKVDGEVYHKDTLNYATAVTALAEPNKEGYTFSGWSNIPTTMPAKHLEVTGTFCINSYLLTVWIDSEAVYSDSIAFGTRMADYVDLITEQGIDLSQWEWYDNIENITMPAHDVSINAIRTIIRPILTDPRESSIYDMTGKKIETNDITTLPAGIYIRNGKKFIVQ